MKVLREIILTVYHGRSKADSGAVFSAVAALLAEVGRQFVAEVEEVEL
jgi:hypothetical protein